jgi:hypothetical protein
LRGLQVLGRTAEEFLKIKNLLQCQLVDAIIYAQQQISEKASQRSHKPQFLVRVRGLHPVLFPGSTVGSCKALLMPGSEV